MLINLLTATAQNTKPKILTIVVKFFLDRSTLKTITICSPEIAYCLVVNKIQKLPKFKISTEKLLPQSLAIKIIENKIAIKREYQKLYSNPPLKQYSETYNCVIVKHTFKSSDSLLNLAKVNFEDQIIEFLIVRLDRPSLVQKEIIHSLVGTNNSLVINIVSSFEISEPRKVDLAATIHERISKKAKLKFTIRKNSKSLIELDTDCFKIYCNLKHYLIEVKTAKKRLTAVSD